MHTGDDLKEQLIEARSKIEIGSKYFHYKNPDKFYTIIDLIIIEATDEVGVVYEAEYAELAGIRFVRPIGSFLGKVAIDDKSIDRFVRINND